MSNEVIGIIFELFTHLTELLLICAIFRIFTINKNVKKLLEAVEKADKRRREEFNALAQSE